MGYGASREITLLSNLDFVSARFLVNGNPISNRQKRQGRGDL
jgi:hypothetical protein